MNDIIKDLSELGLPVYVEGDAPEALPDDYYTISEDYTSDNLNADNEPKEILYEYTLVYYTNDPKKLYSGLLGALQLLRKKRYIISGVGYYHATYKGIWFARQADVNKIEYVEEDK